MHAVPQDEAKPVHDQNPPLVSKPPRDVLRPLRRRAFIAWSSFLLSVGYLYWQRWQSVLHPAALILIGLLALTVLAGLGGFVRGMGRAMIGPRRGRAALLGLFAIIPLAAWSILGYDAYRMSKRKQHPNTIPFLLMEQVGLNLMTTEARYLYPQRLESERIVMIYRDGLPDPDGDLRAMDAHLARMEQDTGLKLREKVWWVRGKLLARGYLCLKGLALGSPEGKAVAVDRHELAHAVMAQHENPYARPPTLLAEGWAESQARDIHELAANALMIREILEEAARAAPGEEDKPGPGIFADVEGMNYLVERIRADGGGEFSYLSTLTDDFWYWHDAGAVYPIGGVFADLVIRRYGFKQFVALYLNCRPAQFKEACRIELNAELEGLERELWQEIKHLANRK